MSIQLKLDAAAMATLFPEGSDIRLELQQAVINETVRKVIDRELSSTRLHIEAQCKKVVKEALDKEGVTSKVWTGVRLSDEYEKKLKDATADAVRTAFSVSVTQTLQPLLDDLHTRIKVRMEGELEIKLALLAKAALREALK